MPNYKFGGSTPTGLTPPVATSLTRPMRGRHACCCAVAQGRRHIEDQEKRIAELGRDGQNTVSERDFLKILKQSQALHVEHRDRLLQELGLPKLEGAPATLWTRATARLPSQPLP